MGQYQQWLHYREQDQQLRAQLEKLETELADLQARAHLLAEPGSYEQNPLLSLLLLATRLDAATTVRAESPVAEPAVEEHDTSSAEGETPALFPWNGLPDLHLSTASASPQPTSSDSTVPSSRLPRPEIELLPEDMAAFLDEHTQTSPQLQLPWWMRQPVPASTSASGNMQPRNTAADQESMRNNRDIARWLERWGRQPHQSQQPGNAEQEGDEAHE